ncbi:Formyltransferase [Lophiostoma macrostomum CBS 122681]|uniref:methionyl-tRNA formyltransferase n=1 Tax=Lophiostoma macrostomum CBS 122681 TaxID=1314788 RepID=A0A6A6TUJ4_9PLEO|nr:Formyltransferase [Lophiostoma macrostomum CBS 122681]
MFGRLRPSVHSFVLTPRRFYSSSKTASPLRVLFCGSDEFSIASLRALNDAKVADNDMIESIDVVHRPGKRTGRGLKIIKDVPIKHVATEELNLNTHIIDTFTGWTPPNPINIIIAVSFGLFVPPRLLNAAEYRGLNVHPSLLPDLRGPAPIHHTLLKHRPTTGVTVQTLHAKHFDHGAILAQTPLPGLEVQPEATPSDLIDQLGKLGGQMLVDVLKTHAYLPPIADAGWYGHSGGPVDHAEKITPAHTYIDFASATLDYIMTRHRVLGHLWCHLPNVERVILDDITPLTAMDNTRGKPGLFISGEFDRLLARTMDGHLLYIQSSTVAGGKKGTGNAHVRRVLEMESE